MRTVQKKSAERPLGGPALFRLVRFWSRRWASGAAQEATDDDVSVGHVLVLEAIAAAAARGSVAVADVAVELGLDRSNASRMLAEAVAAGYVTKSVAADDARRAELGITTAGAELLIAARAWQQEVFERLVASWPKSDAKQFARFLQRLADETLTEGDST